MKFIVEEDFTGRSGIKSIEKKTYYEDRCYRKAYIKSTPPYLEGWYNYGINHRELPGGWMVRDIPCVYWIIEVETLEDLRQLIQNTLDGLVIRPNSYNVLDTYQIGDLAEYIYDRDY